MIAWLALVSLGYVAGSVPFAVLIGKAIGKDPRRAGSGNPGATNLGRVAGKRWGLLCFGFDALKGLAPVVMAGLVKNLYGGQLLEPSLAWLWIAVAGSAVLGHVFPVWLGFRGGKGVATGFGALLGLWPFLAIPAVGAFVVWVIVQRATRNVGVASCAGAIVLPIFAVLVAVFWIGEAASGVDAIAGAWPFELAAALLMILALFTHRRNLRAVFGHGWPPRWRVPVDIAPERGSEIQSTK